MGQGSLATAATTAYGRTLSQYHNWIVRGVFNMAMKSVPYRQDLLKALGPGDEDLVLGDMQEFTIALGGVIRILNQFYSAHELDLSIKLRS